MDERTQTQEAQQEQVAPASKRKKPPAPLPTGLLPLLTAGQAAAYLGKSVRWIFDALRKDPTEPGSIPKAPEGVGGTPRFFPEDLAAWVRLGCPPAADFERWQAAERKKKNR